MGRFVKNAFGQDVYVPSLQEQGYDVPEAPDFFDPTLSNLVSPISGAGAGVPDIEVQQPVIYDEEKMQHENLLLDEEQNRQLREIERKRRAQREEQQRRLRESAEHKKWEAYQAKFDQLLQHRLKSDSTLADLEEELSEVPEFEPRLESARGLSDKEFYKLGMSIEAYDEVKAAWIKKQIRDRRAEIREAVTRDLGLSPARPTLPPSTDPSGFMEISPQKNFVRQQAEQAEQQKRKAEQGRIAFEQDENQRRQLAKQQKIRSRKETLLNSPEALEKIKDVQQGTMSEDDFKAWWVSQQDPQNAHAWEIGVEGDAYQELWARLNRGSLMSDLSGKLSGATRPRTGLGAAMGMPDYPVSDPETRDAILAKLEEKHNQQELEKQQRVDGYTPKQFDPSSQETYELFQKEVESQAFGELVRPKLPETERWYGQKPSLWWVPLRFPGDVGGMPVDIQVNDPEQEQQQAQETYSRVSDWLRESGLSEEEAAKAPQEMQALISEAMHQTRGMDYEDRKKAIRQFLSQSALPELPQDVFDELIEQGLKHTTNALVDFTNANNDAIRASNRAVKNLEQSHYIRGKAVTREAKEQQGRREARESGEIFVTMPDGTVEFVGEDTERPIAKDPAKSRNFRREENNFFNALNVLQSIANNPNAPQTQREQARKRIKELKNEFYTKVDGIQYEENVVAAHVLTGIPADEIKENFRPGNLGAILRNIKRNASTVQAAALDEIADVVGYTIPLTLALAPFYGWEKSRKKTGTLAVQPFAAAAHGFMRFISGGIGIAAAFSPDLEADAISIQEVLDVNSDAHKILAKKNLGGIGGTQANYIREAATSFWQLMMLGTAGLELKGVTAAYSLNEFGDAHTRAIKEGVPDDLAFSHALMSSLAEGVPQLLLPGFSKYASEMARANWQLARKKTLGGVRDFLFGRFLPVAGQELVQENITSVFQLLSTGLFLTDDAKGYLSENWWDTFIETSMVTAYMSLMAAGPGAIGSRLSPEERTKQAEKFVEDMRRGPIKTLYQKLSALASSINESGHVDGINIAEIHRLNPTAAERIAKSGATRRTIAREFGPVIANILRTKGARQAFADTLISHAREVSQKSQQNIREEHGAAEPNTEQKVRDSQGNTHDIVVPAIEPEKVQAFIDQNVRDSNGQPVEIVDPAETTPIEAPPTQKATQEKADLSQADEWIHYDTTGEVLPQSIDRIANKIATGQKLTPEESEMRGAAEEEVDAKVLEIEPAPAAPEAEAPTEAAPTKDGAGSDSRVWTPEQEKEKIDHALGVASKRAGKKVNPVKAKSEPGRRIQKFAESLGVKLIFLKDSDMPGARGVSVRKGGEQTGVIFLRQSLEGEGLLRIAAHEIAHGIGADRVNIGLTEKEKSGLIEEYLSRGTAEQRAEFEALFEAKPESAEREAVAVLAEKLIRDGSFRNRMLQENPSVVAKIIKAIKKFLARHPKVKLSASEAKLMSLFDERLAETKEAPTEAPTPTEAATEVASVDTAESLDAKKVPELRAKLKEMGVKGYSGKNKAGLIKMILEAQAPTDDDVDLSPAERPVDLRKLSTPPKKSNTGKNEWSQTQDPSSNKRMGVAQISKYLIGAYMQNTFDGGIDELIESNTFGSESNPLNVPFEAFYVSQVNGASDWVATDKSNKPWAEKVIAWLGKEASNPHPEKWGRSWLLYNKQIEIAREKAPTPTEDDVDLSPAESDESVVSLKNASVNADFIAAGLAPPTKAAQMDFQNEIDEAAKYDEGAVQDVVQKYLDNPNQPPSVRHEAVILLYYQRLRDNPDASLDRLEEVGQLIDFLGTSSSRSLAFRRMWLSQDYTLDGMKRQMEAVLKGKEGLSKKETAEMEKRAAEYKKKKERAENAQKTKRNIESNARFEDTVDDIVDANKTGKKKTKSRKKKPKQKDLSVTVDGRELNKERLMGLSKEELLDIAAKLLPENYTKVENESWRAEYLSTYSKQDFVREILSVSGATEQSEAQAESQVASFEMEREIDDLVAMLDDEDFLLSPAKDNKKPFSEKLAGIIQGVAESEEISIEVASKKVLDRVLSGADPSKHGVIKKAYTKAKKILKETGKKETIVPEELTNEQVVEALKGNLSKIVKADEQEKINKNKKTAYHKIARQLLEHFVGTERQDAKQALDSIYEVFEDALPGEFTKDRVRELASDYGIHQSLSKEETKVRIRNARGFLRQLSKIHDMREKGQQPKKSGVEQHTPDTEERQLIKIVNRLKKNLDLNDIDPEKSAKTALESLKTRLRNEIEDLQNAIDNGNPLNKERIPVDRDAAAKELEKLKQEKIAEYNEAFPKEVDEKAERERRLVNRIKHEDKRIEELEQAIEKNQPIERSKESPPMSEELAKRQEKRRKLVEKYNELFPPPKVELTAQQKLERREQAAERTINALRNALHNGERIKRSEVDETMVSAALREMQAEIAVLREEYNRRFPPVKRKTDRAKQEAARIKAAEESIAAMEEALRTGRRIPKAPRMATSPVLEKIIQRRERIRREYRKRFPRKPRAVTEEQRIASAEAALRKSIQRVRRRIRTKDISPLVRRFVSTPLLDSLRAEKELLDKELREMRRLATALSPQEKAKRRRMAALLTKKKQMKADLIAGQRTKRKNSPEYDKTDKDIIALENEIADITRDYVETFGLDMAVDRTVTGILRQIKEYRNRIAEGRITADRRSNKEVEAHKNVVQARKDLLDAQRDFARFKEDVLWERMNVVEKVARVTADTWDGLKTLKASYDFSGFRQALTASLARPLLAIKAGGNMARATVTEEQRLEIEDRLANDKYYSEAKAVGISFNQRNGVLSAQEEGYMSRWIDRYSGEGFGTWRGSAVSGLAASERAFSTLLNTMRLEYYKDLTVGQDYSIEEKKHLASFVNAMTGRGGLGKSDMMLVGANRILWAPRLLVSRAQILSFHHMGAGLFFGKGKTGNFRKGKMFAVVGKEYLRMLRPILAVAALSWMFMSDDEWKEFIDPRSPKFGCIKIGDVYLDWMGGFKPVARFAAQNITGSTVTFAGKEKEFGDDVFTTRGTVFMNFLRTKLHPSLGLAVSVVEGSDLVGRPMTPTRTAFEAAAPLWPASIAAGVLSEFKKEGVSAAGARFLLELPGMFLTNTLAPDELSNYESIFGEIPDPNKKSPAQKIRDKIKQKARPKKATPESIRKKAMPK